MQGLDAVDGGGGAKPDCFSRVQVKLGITHGLFLATNQGLFYGFMCVTHTVLLSSVVALKISYGLGRFACSMLVTRSFCFSSQVLFAIKIVLCLCSDLSMLCNCFVLIALTA